MRITVFSKGELLGQIVVNTALAHGDYVTLYMPDTTAIWPRKNLTVMQGSLSNQERVMEALLDADTVISTILAMPLRRKEDRVSMAESNALILKAMEHLGKIRFVTVGSDCISAFGDTCTPARRIPDQLRKVFYPYIYQDMQKLAQVLTHCQLNWTLVRVRSVNSREGVSAYEVSLDKRDCKKSVSWQDIADFLYDAAGDPGKYSRKMPVIFRGESRQRREPDGI